MMKSSAKTCSSNEQNKAGLFSWLMVLGLTAFFCVWGLFIFFTVGDKGPPPWDFGVVPDIPGESPYSNYGPRFVPGQGITVPPQHVDTQAIEPYGLTLKEMP